MGAIYRRNDGRWSTCVSINGKQKHLYGKTREEVEQKRDALLAELPAPASAPGRQLVSDYLTTWLQETVRVRNKPSTYKSYSQMTNQHIIPAIGHYQLRSLTPEHVQRMLNNLHSSGRSARTVKYTQMILHRALNQAVKWEYVTRNVAALVDAPRVEKYQATALTEQQIISLFESVRGHRLEALYWLALLGMRKGELLALEWRSVDLASGTLKITEGKTANSRRTLPLSPSLVAVLQKHWEQQQGERKQKGVDWKEHGLVFPSAVGTPLSPRNLTTTYKRALKRAGIPQSVRFHDLRHTAATLLLKQNAPKVVQMLLGHAQSSTTMEVYAHVALEQKEEAVRSLEGLFQLLSG